MLVQSISHQSAGYDIGPGLVHPASLSSPRFLSQRLMGQKTRMHGPAWLFAMSRIPRVYRARSQP